MEQPGPDASITDEGVARLRARSGVGHLQICVDIRSMTAPEDFARHIERLIEETKATPTAPGTEEIFVPGEPETRTAERLTTEGITIADVTRPGPHSHSEELSA